MFRKIIFAILIIIVSFYSCHSSVEDELTRYRNSNKSDTLASDIPKNMSSTSYSSMKKNIERMVGLSSIENGFEDFQIRIWSSVASDDSEQLIGLTNKSSMWTAELYNLKFVYNKNYDSIISINKQGGIKEPKSSWKYVINNLVRLKILKLPDYSTFPNYYVSTDANGATVEISSKNKYRTYSYPNIILYKNKIAEVKNMDDILMFLQDEFNFKLIK